MPSWLLESMDRRGAQPAIVGAGAVSYGEIVRATRAWQEGPLRNIGPGAVIGFDAEHGAAAIAALLAIAIERCVAVPLSSDATAHRDEYFAIAQVEYLARERGGGSREGVGTGRTAGHPLYTTLRAREHPGLVLFSSGSTGRSKGAVHDLRQLLEKFKTSRPAYRTLAFLQFDHIGGLNTIFHTLANGGTLVVAEQRTPAAVCAAIEQHRAELLPSSPTFLNLLLLSEEHRRHDLSSLKLVTYGTEPMPASTLQRVATAFPGVRLLQTYGLSELGILRSQSRGSDSLWVRIGGEGFETKVVDGRLRIRAQSAMLGYLNAPSPFDADGYFDTGDLVEIDGEWLRFVGRHNEVINVGGSKVFPSEVESVLLDMDNVADATVSAETSPITGHIVSATVRLVAPETPDQFKLRMRRFCGDRLSAYKVPVRVRIVNEPLHTERFKRRRISPQA